VGAAAHRGTQLHEKLEDLLGNRNLRKLVKPKSRDV
jgi:hypothetical protein